MNASKTIGILVTVLLFLALALGAWIHNSALTVFSLTQRQLLRGPL